jgi:hypothetical protein
MGYRPNLAARNLARGTSGVVLYLVPHVAVGEMPMIPAIGWADRGRPSDRALVDLGQTQVSPPDG